MSLVERHPRLGDYPADRMQDLVDRSSAGSRQDSVGSSPARSPEGSLTGSSESCLPDSGRRSSPVYATGCSPLSPEACTPNSRPDTSRRCVRVCALTCLPVCLPASLKGSGHDPKRRTFGSCPCPSAPSALQEKRQHCCRKPRTCGHLYVVVGRSPTTNSAVGGMRGRPPTRRLWPEHLRTLSDVQ